MTPEARREIIDIAYKRSSEQLEAGDLNGALFHKSYLNDALTLLPATDPLHAVASAYVATLDERIRAMTTR